MQPISHVSWSLAIIEQNPQPVSVTELTKPARSQTPPVKIAAVHLRHTHSRATTALIGNLIFDTARGHYPKPESPLRMPFDVVTSRAFKSPDLAFVSPDHRNHVKLPRTTARTKRRRLRHALSAKAAPKAAAERITISSALPPSRDHAAASCVRDRCLRSPFPRLYAAAYHHPQNFHYRSKPLPHEPKPDSKASAEAARHHRCSIPTPSDYRVSAFQLCHRAAVVRRRVAVFPPSPDAAAPCRREAKKTREGEKRGRL